MLLFVADAAGIGNSDAFKSGGIQRALVLAGITVRAWLAQNGNNRPYPVTNSVAACSPRGKLREHRVHTADLCVFVQKIHSSKGETDAAIAFYSNLGN
jgi:hypothetical protein